MDPFLLAEWKCLLQIRNLTQGSITNGNRCKLGTEIFKLPKKEYFLQVVRYSYRIEYYGKMDRSKEEIQVLGFCVGNAVLNITSG